MASLALAGCCPYAALCISQDAPHEEVASAYRKLVVKSHPDKGGTPEMFRKVNEAYGVLKHADYRSIYNSHSHLGIDFALTLVDKKKNQEAEERTDKDESHILSQTPLPFQGSQAKTKAKGKTAPRPKSDADFADRMHRDYQSWKREEMRKEELREKERKDLCERAHAEIVAKEQAAKADKRAQIASTQSKKMSKKNRAQEQAAQGAAAKAAFRIVVKQLKDRSCFLKQLSETESSKAGCERKVQILHRKVLECEKLDSTTKPSDRNKQQKEKIKNWKDFKDELSKCEDELSKHRGHSQRINENLLQLTVLGGQHTQHQPGKANQ